jgi:hypothetical protein
LYEILETYVRRLATCYCVRYETFCRRALGIQMADSKSRSLAEPSREVLQRLSDGAGIPIEQLEQMTLKQGWSRLQDEFQRIVETSEGRAEFERYLGFQTRLLDHESPL